jgi:hypothetical protein
MEYARREGMDWRTELHRWIESELAHRVFNPNVESEKFLAKHLPSDNFRSLKSKNPARFRQLVRKLVELDSREIAYRSDYVICYWDRSAQRGAGTKGELTIAKFFGKPVYMVTRMKTESIPGWVLGCTTEIFPSFTKLKRFLMKRYGHIHSR